MKKFPMIILEYI